MDIKNEKALELLRYFEDRRSRYIEDCKEKLKQMTDGDLKLIIAVCTLLTTDNRNIAYIAETADDILSHAKFVLEERQSEGVRVINDSDYAEFWDYKLSKK